MQVCPVGQTTCEHGSLTLTQRAWQTVPEGHSEAIVAQGLSAQRPPMHTWPVGHPASFSQSPVKVSVGVGRSTGGVGTSGVTGRSGGVG